METRIGYIIQTDYLQALRDRLRLVNHRIVNMEANLAEMRKEKIILEQRVREMEKKGQKELPLP